MENDGLEPRVLAELLGLIAHDLRNPLSALHSNVSFLDSVIDGADQDLHETVADALVSCDGLLHIIGNLDLLAYALEGHEPKPSVPFALGPVVMEVVTRAEAAAKSHEVALAPDPSLQALETQVVAHREMLVRALDNLLYNAIQYGGSSVPIRISVSERDGRACVLIADGGVPLARELRESGFSAKGQLSSKGVGGGRYGRGIGLFSAKVAAQAAHAEIVWVQPGPGGNGFELSLALA